MYDVDNTSEIPGKSGMPGAGGQFYPAQLPVQPAAVFRLNVVHDAVKEKQGAALEDQAVAIAPELVTFFTGMPVGPLVEVEASEHVNPVKAGVEEKGFLNSVLGADGTGESHFFTFIFP